jgi:hypothetical protein
VSEVGPAPPAGAEGLPVRPPSKKSRLPLVIWAGIAIFCLVMFGTALGLFLWSRKAFSSEDLKTASSVKVNYLLKGNQTKSVVVNDPAELRALLDALKITDTQPGQPWTMQITGTVEFSLPDGTVARTMFVSQRQLERTGWGQVMVEPDFYRKVNEIATRAEGKPIDIMRVDN